MRDSTRSCSCAPIGSARRRTAGRRATPASRTSRTASRSRRSSPTSSSTRTTVASGLIHDVVEDTAVDARRRRARVRQGDRRDRRRADEDRQAAEQRLEPGPAGRELPQAAAVDREGRARHHRQARRPAAQHADARLPARRRSGAASRRRRATCTRRSRTASVWRRCGGSSRTSRSSTSRPEEYKALAKQVAQKRGEREELIAALQGAARSSELHEAGHQERRGHRPAEAPLVDLQEDEAARQAVRGDLRPPRDPRARQLACPTATTRSASSTTGGRRCRSASRTTSRSRSRTATSRCTRRCSGRAGSCTRSRSARARCTARRTSASPRTGCTRRTRRARTSWTSTCRGSGRCSSCSSTRRRPTSSSSS